MSLVLEAEVDGGCKIRPEGELTIYRVADYKPQLIQVLESHPSIVVDLSRVTEFDTAGLQLLILLKREAKARGITSSFTGHSAEVTELFQLFDMVPYFGDPLVMPQDDSSRRASV
ncbi:predicted sulfate transporter/antisigma-factor antagonist STAS [gamma proteobacterium HdN1]|nr:predicted sulfate transporter/antisigma-factor antagonist STAS [gamma proteobacterium HdN1]